MMERPVVRRNKVSGLGVDAAGGPVVDPTENVLALTAAEAKRQDDLRAAGQDLQNEKNRCTKEVAELHASYAEKMGKLEASRLDAIRQVDALGVKTALETVNTATATLAKTTELSAQTLRDLVATTATTFASQLDGVVARQNERIAALEKTSYTGSGRSTGSQLTIDKLLIILGLLLAAAAIWFKK